MCKFMTLSRFSVNICRWILLNGKREESIALDTNEALTIKDLLMAWDSLIIGLLPHWRSPWTEGLEDTNYVTLNPKIPL